MLKISAIETAEENERGIVDIETLQKTQNDLIETIQETLRIQKEGKEKTQKEVADLLGISQSYISRLEKKIIHRLKREIIKME